MTTLRDVARATGFSMTTVSRALRGFDDVSEATRRRIEDVARTMNYRPHQIARKLVTGRSGMVGLVIDAPPQPFEHGHFLELVTGLSMAFAARDLDFVLRVGNGQDTLATHERLVSRGALDGFVLTLPVLGDRRIDLLLERSAAFVVHGHQRGDDRYPYFDTDNRAVSSEAVRLLAAAGHRRIGLVAGPADWPSVCDRVAGFHAAAAEHGLAVDPRLVLHGDTSEAYGGAALGRLLALGADRPSAIVCCNSLAAAGICAAAARAGLRLPADLSLVAHDDVLPQVRTEDLGLTVTRLALRDACAPLADLLVRRIAGEPVEALQLTRAPEVVVRRSVGPA